MLRIVAAALLALAALASATSPRRPTFPQPTFSMCATMPFNTRRGHSTEPRGRAAHDDAPYLVFGVCKGLNNQRLALLNGLALAADLGAIAVLPAFYAEYVTDPGAGPHHNTRPVPFSHYWDETHFYAAARAAGVRVAPPNVDVPTDSFSEFEVGGAINAAPNLAMLRDAAAHYSVVAVCMCLLKRYDWDTPARIALRQALVNALVPSAAVMQRARPIIDSLIARSPTHRFSALLLRTESDFYEYCQDGLKDPWRSLVFSLDSCYIEAGLVAETLRRRLPANEPLFIAGGSSNRADQLEPFAAYWDVVTKEDVLPSVHEDVTGTEDLAAIDYAVSRAAASFAGLIYSSFSFLQKEERLYGAPGVPAGSAFSYYNLPLDRCHLGICAAEQRFWDCYPDAYVCEGALPFPPCAASLAKRQ